MGIRELAGWRVWELVNETPALFNHQVVNSPNRQLRIIASVGRAPQFVTAARGRRSSAESAPPRSRP
jgi:hypothetical protein